MAYQGLVRMTVMLMKLIILMGTIFAFCLVNAQSLSAQAVYVTSGNGISTVDPSRQSVVTTIPTSATFLTVTQDGSRLYASAFNGLDVIDTSTNAILTTIPVGANPFESCLSPDGKKLYVAHFDSSAVLVIDTSNNSIISTISVPGNPIRIAISPDNKKVYVSTRFNGLIVLDPATNSVVHQVSGLPAGAFPLGISFSPDGNRAYVGEFGGPVFYVVDARNDVLIQAITISGAQGGISGIVSTPDGSRIYLANVRTSPTQGPRAVFGVDTNTNSVIATIPVGEPSGQFAISKDATKVFVGDTDTGNLDVIDTTTNTIVGTIHVSDFLVINGVATQSPRPTQATGKITVSTNNAAATFTINDGNGHSFNGSGLSFIQTAPPNTYTVQYGVIPKFLTPLPQTQTLTAGGQINFTGTYVPAGTLRVSTNLATATFEIDGPVVLTGSGTSREFINVPAGVYKITYGGQPDCFSGTPPQQTQTLIGGGTVVFSGDYEVGFLSFPLPAAAPCTANISTVFDHSQTRQYSKQKTVTAYTGEQGMCVPGSTDVCESKVSHTSQFGFLKPGEVNVPFIINSNYTGGKGPCVVTNLQGTTSMTLSTCRSVLFYNGHPGIDYPASCGTAVYASADGVVHYPKSVPGIPNATRFHVLELDLSDFPGYKLYYLHLSTYPNNHSKRACESKASINEGEFVRAGQPIGLVGDEGVPGAFHLHFEVQLNGIPVDPYGWKKNQGADPYKRATNHNLWK